MHYIARTNTRNEYYLNPQLDGLTGAEYRRMSRYLNSIGELVLKRHVVEQLPPKCAFDDNRELIFVNLTAADIRSHIGQLATRP